MPPPDAAAAIDSPHPPYHHSAAIADADSGELKMERQAKFWGKMVERYGLATVFACVLLAVFLTCVIGAVVVLYRDVGKPAFDRWLIQQEAVTAHTNQATATNAAKLEIDRANQDQIKSVADSLKSLDAKSDVHTNILKAIHHKLTPSRERDDEHGAASTPSESPPGLDHPCD